MSYLIIREIFGRKYFCVNDDANEQGGQNWDLT